MNMRDCATVILTMAQAIQLPDSPFWWIRHRKNGKTRRLNTKVPHYGRKKEPLAVSQLVVHLAGQELLERTGVYSSPDPVSIDAWHTAFFEDRRHLSEGRQFDLGAVVRAWRQFARAQGLRHVQAVTAEHGQAFLSTLAQQAPATRAKKMKILCSMWNMARSKGWVTGENPFKVRIQIPAAETEPYSDEDLRILRGINTPAWFPVICRIGIYTGARAGSCLALDWQDVLFEMKVLHFRTSKTGSYSVPMHPALQKSLLQWFWDNGRPPGPVFPELRERSPSYLSKTFARIARRSGVSAPKFHRFRHTFVTILAESGIDMRHAMELANHRGKEVHDIYTHVRAERLADVIVKAQFGEEPAESRTVLASAPDLSGAQGCS